MSKTVDLSQRISVGFQSDQLMTDECKNDGVLWSYHHMLMLDYDDLPCKVVVEDVKRLQGLFGLDCALLVESSPEHFHAYFFCDWEDYFEQLRVVHASRCDTKFKMWRMIRKNFTLRISGKNGFVPVVRGVIKSENWCECSSFMIENPRAKKLFRMLLASLSVSGRVRKW